jgi:hypothetical protein
VVNSTGSVQPDQRAQEHGVAHPEHDEPLALVAQLGGDPREEQRGREQHDAEHVAVRAVVRRRRIVGMGAGLGVQASAGRPFGHPVLGHRERRLRCIMAAQRIRQDPGIERRPELRPEPLAVEAGQRRVAADRRVGPLDERGDVDLRQLAGPGRRLRGLDPSGRRLPRIRRLLAAPLRGLVCAPGGGDRRHGQQQRGQPLDVRVPALFAHQLKTFTARAITRPTTISEITDCAAIISFAQARMGITSVGLNAVLVVMPRMK